MWEPVVCKYCVLGWCSLWLRLGGDGGTEDGCCLQHGQAPRGSLVPQHLPVAHPPPGERCNLLSFPSYTPHLEKISHLLPKMFGFSFF